MTGSAVAGSIPAVRYDAWFESAWGRYAWRIETGAVLAALGPLDGRRVADIGCGTGRLLDILTSHGARAVGIDTNPQMLTLAATRGLVARADAHRLPLADASVDAAVTVATLEFTADPAQVLTEMARITQPGGRLVAAVLSSRASERLRVPAPAFFLIAAALASDIWPWLGRLSYASVEQVATVALAVILFDGGMRMGWRRFRSAAVASVWIGVAGTLVTAAAVAAAARLLFSFGWHTALLIGTALAPTDPAVVFSVLGRREIAGRSGVLLEGESGANDPVGIALLIALLTATGTGMSAASHVAVEFGIQMAVGIVAGAAGGKVLLVFMRRVPLPSEGLHTLHVLAGALAIYGLATVAHGPGFLAVFIAGILIGDERAPYKGEIAHFHSALASLAEIVAFVMLGLTIRLYALPRGGAWLIGLALAALLAFVIRPLLVGALLWPVRLRPSERVFVLWSGLKGAVPILLGAFIVQAGVKDAPRIYEIIFVVVAFSVIVQGGAVPGLARRLKIPLRTIEPEPWSLGIRFQEEPEDLHRFVITAGAAAASTPISGLPPPEDTWISFIIRNGRLVPAHADTMLQPNDEVVALAAGEDEASLRELSGS